MAKTPAICPNYVVEEEVCEDGEGINIEHMDVSEIPPEVHHGNPLDSK